LGFINDTLFLQLFHNLDEGIMIGKRYISNAARLLGHIRNFVQVDHMIIIQSVVAGKDMGHGFEV